jgi:hypothetical protein
MSWARRRKWCRPGGGRTGGGDGRPIGGHPTGGGGSRRRRGVWRSLKNTKKMESLRGNFIIFRNFLKPYMCGKIDC